MAPPLAFQAGLFGDCPVEAAIRQLADDSSTEERGAIYTRREVVDFMLDLAGYSAERDLTRLRFLEPSFGAGDFLLPAIERLLSAANRAGHGFALDDCIRAVELHRDTYESTFAKVVQTLMAWGHSEEGSRHLARRWLICDDFLLAPMRGAFDVVVGNPPYVRQELIPEALLNEYRARYSTLYDRADLYVPFMQRALELLADGGEQCFICADRWMKNKYGAPLRRFITTRFRLKAYVDLSEASAFHSEVIAYPAITLIARVMPGATRVAVVTDVERLAELTSGLMGSGSEGTSDVRLVGSLPADGEPWVLAEEDSLSLIRRLEGAFPTLEQAGCKVGIGVATGADRAFIGLMDELGVEDDRKLPLAMTRDIDSGEVRWRGFGVINPFRDDGRLVDLAAYPKLRAFLEERRDIIANRHVAKKDPSRWFRTIDRITPSLAVEPKLLIPDIKGHAQVVFEDGRLYPHHNLYFVTASEWDLRALQAVLLSDLTRFFIASYSTRMRGGFLRFQAQYLRRIRLPFWKDVPSDMRSRLGAAARALDVPACNGAVAELYGLTEADMALTRNEGAQRR
ncbi:MAG: Eco57I restriction-modification methylase domain-containing protein [Methyloversatilis sp.]|uniref:Eco57I restriction-modification methylase domain-containing protein n=1 Tax=Methyloversatilis sp. TaxID=2569862 RepID=UPI00273380A6|nr:Eco57I restriction-modification methylase domain-containing protein [Methyloversatilis sp.]MDP3872414.1 Eco57I restriction-modification methylase domain-containing protein [Methyloversatilis sp.]